MIAAGSTSTAALSVDPTHATDDSETVADNFSRLMPASLCIKFGIQLRELGVDLTSARNLARILDLSR